MSFRRSKEQARDKRAWEAFREAQLQLIEGCGLPLAAVSSQRVFDYLLMHGALPEGTAEFDVDRLGATEFQTFRELVYRYFDAGYPDPGLVVLPADDRSELSRKYPSQFNG